MAAAVATFFLLFKDRWTRGLVILFGIAIAIIGIGDAVRAHKALKDATLFGVHVASVGWGLYIVATGGLVIALGALVAWINSPPRTTLPRPFSDDWSRL